MQSLSRILKCNASLYFATMKTPSAKTYLVGGAVRDQLLNYPYSDRDWVVVGATPQLLLDQGYQQVGKDFPVFLHPQTKEEYALARKERKQGSGYHGFICDFGPEISLEEDLSRRDLRINAMAKDDDGNIVDPFGGQQDIADRVLRHISPAFSEDPLRVIRVARYAARYAHLGFKVADETMALMQTMSAGGELQTIAAERLWVEFSRALSGRSPQVFLQVLVDCGALQSLCPQWPPALSNRVLQALSAAAEQALSVDIRFAISCAELTVDECRQLCESLRSSKAAQQLAQLYAQHIPLPTLTDADAILATLERFDYLRRPELLTDFTAGAALLISENTKPALNMLKQAATQARQIQAATLIDQGITGKALGEALRQARVEAIGRIL